MKTLQHSHQKHAQQIIIKLMKREHTMTTTNNALTSLDVPLTKGIVKLTGKDGNAFLVLGLVNRAILESDKPELADEFFIEAVAGDYEHLLQTCIHYVTVE